MKPLIVLLSVFVVSSLIARFGYGSFQLALAGRIAMCCMLAFTAMRHFIFTKGMSMMLPTLIPFKPQVVYLTGVAEVAFAIGLSLPAYRVLSGWLLIVFLVFAMPANVNASHQRLDYQKATLDGSGPRYLWVRIPLQIVFIVWTYFCAIRYGGVL